MSHYPYQITLFGDKLHSIRHYETNKRASVSLPQRIVKFKWKKQTHEHKITIKHRWPEINTHNRIYMKKCTVR